MENGVRALFSKKELGRTSGALFGTLIYAAGINLFIVPVGVYSGGIMGICQIIRTILIRFFHVDFGAYDFAGIIYYIINIPLFFLAFRTMGKLFFVKTMICTVAVTFFLTAIPIPAHLLVKDDILTNCLIGGIVSGVGSGLTLIMGGSGGGMDIIGLYYVMRRKRSGVGQVSLAVNVVLYAVCFALFDITTAVYSIIVAVADSIAIDRLHTQNINVEVMIISKKDMRQFQSDFMSQLGRGLTKWNITGAYTNENSEIFYIILSKYEVAQLRHLVRKYDSEAFIVVNEGVRVDGNYLKKL
ncbi:Uncharacterized membrane-anchored protein YitT, contains DUF161 and DUF2179 domains [Sporobacter termitidis DSM 10068]|uniref:Uncharacterized membrane-anchored protein YitT, contains DUF161 and DUF2179 domains n=1 Tax=Sporobacter termitidis DSM 10068 TaxID=1123282 RepID=A0A1M5VGU6_9FIRM|nr:YitT family protein [Sporobacter termitidis]SHH74324.1 Uncharacterized membrane-anchored protein YitT, contains DUF161 and DUF2179 domains [Sporobacter termitidis DSM 10068]